jgi:autotransporter-associated beta strand protein
MKLFLRSITFFIAINVSLASGQTTWKGAGNNSINEAFENSSNWSNGVPIGTTDATVDTSVTINQTSANQSAQTFTFQSGGTINFNLASGSILTVTGVTPALLSPISAIIGSTTLNFSGGHLIMNDGVFNVGDTGGTGTLNLLSGTLNYDVQTAPDATQISVGNNGTGTVTQSGTSAVTTGEALFIGSNGGTGNYTMTGASSLQTGTKLSQYFIAVGADQDATTTGTNGTLTISGNATLTLNAGAQLQLGTAETGLPTPSNPTPTPPASVHATGVVTQNGAGTVVNVNGTALNPAVIFVGTVTGGTGTYNLQAGNLNIGSHGFLSVGNDSGTTGIVNQSGGTLTGQAGSRIAIGESGLGTYDLSGGTANFIGGFVAGDLTGSQGIVNQAGGALTAGNVVTLGNSGNGVYNLSGGTATFNNTLFVSATGAVNQTGGTLTITPGQTLDLTTAGSVYNLNGGTLQTGTIKGSGSAAGRLNFGGGALQAIGAALLTDSLNGTVSNTSTLDTTNHNIFLNGNLGGSGGFNIIGNNVVFLDGANTFTGAINVNSGTLQATIANLSSNAINIGSAGTFFMARTAPAAVDHYAGTISGLGTFETGANATLILDNPINFAGTTVIGFGGAGTLEVGSGSFGNITEGAAGSNFIVGGATPGTVNFTGNNTFTGTTTVNTGFTLLANNLSGSIANAGMLASNLALPAVQASTFTIGNNFNSTGNFLVRTNGTTTDLYTVGGASTLSGTVTITGAGSMTNQVIVNSAGALNVGGLTAVITGANVLFTGSIHQVGNTEVLTTVQLPTAAFALTPNQMAVSGAIDPVILNLPVSFAPIVTALNNLPASQIPGALDQLSPESLQYSRDIAFENATFLVEHVDGHLAALRNGYTGLDTSGLSMVMPGFDSGLGRSLGSLLAYNSPAPNGVNYYPSDLDETSPNANRSMSDSANPMTDTQPRSSRFRPNPNFSEFVSGDVILADLNRNQSTANSPPTKASYTAGNVTAGISFRMSSSLAAGVLFDYNHTDAKTDSAGSKTTVDTFSPGLFATYYQNGFYVNGLASYGYNEYSNNRNLSFGGLNSTANSSPTGSQYVANLDFGYDFKPDKHWKIGPTLGATYTHLDVNSFNETGAGPADLSVNNQHADSVRSRLGGQAVYQFHTSGILFAPTITAAWQHEYMDRSSGITSQFNIPGSNPFTIQTAAPSRDSALIGFGGTATLDNSMAFYLDYLLNVSEQDYFAQSIEGGFKARF